MDSRELGIEAEDLDPLQRHYATAYSAAELNTFHCDRVRKMPLSGLDPSMLMGFLCKNEAEWQDLKQRILEVQCYVLGDYQLC
jgi:cysteine protease ATG4